MGLYKTIKNESCEEFIEKRSKFIGAALPVQSEEEAIAFITQKREKYWNATHNVYAYIVRDQNIMRYSDDGEPQGTAGVPVLDVLKKSGIVNAAVVVTRYFGGILLGAGGLVRAYSHSAKMAVDAAKIITMRKCRILKLNLEYFEYGKINALISSYTSKIIKEDFLDNVNIEFCILEEEIGKFFADLSEITSGKVSPEVLGEDFFEV